MQFTESIAEKISLIDQVLKSRHHANLLANTFFAIHELSCPEYLRIQSHKIGCIAVDIVIDPQGVEISLDRINEALDWSSDLIHNRSELFKKCIEEILFNGCTVEYIGKSITKISFFDSEGNPVRRFKHIQGIPLSFKKEKKILEPLLKSD